MLNINAMVILNRIKRAGLPEPVEEFQFCKDRQFRADFAWPDKMILLEYEGGILKKNGKGAHNRSMGYLKDCRKYNLATILGYKILRYTFLSIDDIVPDLKELLK